MLATMVAGAAMGAAAAGTWVTGRAWTPLAEQAIEVRGLDAAPVLGATALLLLAAGLALGLAGRRAGRITGVAVAAAGALAAVSTLTVLRDPAGPARAAAQETLGVAQVEDAAVAALPWAGLAVAIAVVLLGGWVTVAAGRWGATASRGGSRYRRATQAADPASGGQSSPAAGPDDVTAWDALTRGEDPT
ncbi:hypothetical protein AFE02nite_08080 [Actinotalea fermentans]|uniref:TIGR02234 family membrane protein n=1 Tax=Actinotalea fermentans TaxID=43671 RepID=A0A511YV45_9CELL|nr:hypothetical protein AFE02nite_08080 [Actinotalea fermentans]